ncbi:zinc finger protein 664-like isoform X5 [Thrips palmi]|uniref:Zinc finger protein 664-like isoform X5 n=1 Tax=Thrips palmi TaxID=161013 RepID=A0A6P8Z7P1_THRPL|nr:zinc finger protein 664-like isoform X5 [Thrips palmi]
MYPTFLSLMFCHVPGILLSENDSLSPFERKMTLLRNTSVTNVSLCAWRVKTEAEECGSPPAGGARCGLSAPGAGQDDSDGAWRVKVKAEQCDSPPAGACSTAGPPGQDDSDGLEAEEPWLHIDATFSLASGVGHAKQDSAASGTAGDGGADRAVASQCAERGAALDAEAGLEKHLAARGKRHACQHCGKEFQWASHLEAHSRTHTGGKAFQCKVCGKKFALSGNLSQHERTHTGEKPFQCKVCGKKFTQSGHLSRHVRIHTGEKPFQCKVCEMKFTQSGDLMTHERLHTGEKPFQCQVCAMTFTSLGNLTKHKRIHTGEKPFECNVCAKKFASSSNLTRHERIHTR